MLEKYTKNVSKNPNVFFGEILDNSLCGRVPAEKLGHVKIFFYIILHSREFLSSRGHSSCLDGLCPASMGPIHLCS